MDIKLHPIHFTPKTSLEEFVNKKVTKLEKLHDGIISADVFLKVVKPETSNNKEAEIKIKAPSAEYFAQKVADSFEEAVDACLMAIEKQIEKSKEKSK